MHSIIIHFAICFVFYIIGAYATTDILRLLKGSTVSVNAPDCYCPICNNKIALTDQLPIIAYIKNKGKCHSCNSPIPISDLFLEVFLFVLMSCISFLFSFNRIAYLLCILLYEGTKIAFLLIHGARTDNFVKNLFISLKNNIFIFLLLGFLFFLEHLVV